MAFPLEGETGKTRIAVLCLAKFVVSFVCIIAQVVSVALEDAMGRKATWEGGEPPLLRRRHGRNRADSIICVVEKVVPHSALFRWLTSPCSLEQPPEILKKEQIEQ